MARKAKIFSNESTRWTIEATSACHATGDSFKRLMEWKAQMKDDVSRQNAASNAPQFNEGGESVRYSPEQHDAQP
jgi:hypothetical protein